MAPKPTAPKPKMKNLIGTLKDKISLIKTTILLSNTTASSAAALVLRVTTHDPSTSPSDYLVDDEEIHSNSAFLGAFISALLSRLNGTANAIVAIKCLLALHRLLSRPSPALLDQFNTTHFLNLSNFRDQDSIELSSWVRWYGAVIEQTLIVARSIKFRYSSSKFPSGFSSIDPKDRILAVSSEELLNEVRVLVGLIETISTAPGRIEDQRIGLIHEAMKIVGEEYRMTMREVAIRVEEIKGRVKGLSRDELTGLGTELGKLLGSRDRLVSMFLNKKSNDGVWDLIEATKVEVGVAAVKMIKDSSVRLIGWV
ncbi:hypothetical protein Droror1_Dr00011295 [Drosera rotundifolia]